jgi:hypothetical protein
MRQMKGLIVTDLNEKPHLVRLLAEVRGILWRGSRLEHLSVILSIIRSIYYYKEKAIK